MQCSTGSIQLGRQVDSGAAQVIVDGAIKAVDAIICVEISRAQIRMRIKVLGNFGGPIVNLSRSLPPWL